MKSLLFLAAAFLISVPVFAQESYEDNSTNNEEHTITVNDDSITVQESYNYNFGFVKKGKSENARFRLRNNGSYPFYINDIDTSGKAFSHKENCGGVLWPGQACRATVKFAPKQVGQFNGSLHFDLIGRSDIWVFLRGWGYNY
ncbi:choice-of-anchor D domain-containing protein [Bdellovibrio sp. HCB185ZH]|uniref:choice-of-anchor D domain-containing protein n=1 Tax=Bdellovibrio sp. HCB185ZH TaxID=3394235 RepID=UPI0039A6B947